MRLTRIGVAVALVAAGVSSVATSAAAAPATEPSTLQCASSVPIFRVTTAGELFLYQHNEPETGGGTESWTPSPPRIGLGWQDGRSVAAPDGIIYAAWNDGKLRRYHHISGTTWEMFNGSFHQVIDPSGWERYVTPEYKNRITVDADGFIYTIEPDGYLHQRAYNPTTQQWTHRVIGAGWGQFNLIVAGGPGVLYARKPNGELLRYRYHSASQRWLINGNPVGAGWQMFDRIFSPGGDLLYGVRGDHVGHDNEMLWYRFNEDTDTFASGTGQLIGRGWIDWNTSAAPNACQRVGTTVPIRPQVTPQPLAPVTLMRSSNGHVHYSYVDSNRRAVHVDIADILSGSPAGAAVIPGFDAVTGQTGISEHQDGTVQVIGRRTDSEILTSTRSATGGPWGSVDTLGGFVNGPATPVRLVDGRVAMYAADGASQIWYRRQPVANGPLTGWLQMPLGRCVPPCTQPAIDDGPLFADNPSGSAVRLIARDRDGRYWTITHNPDGLASRWIKLGTQQFVGPASVVVLPDATRQVFATGTDGTVYTQRETTSGFPGTWTPIPGLTAKGRPSAIMAPNGTIQMVVRASDDFIYFTGQPAPGSGTFNPWVEVTNFTEKSSTDPTALPVPEHTTWVLAYRTTDDVPRLLRFQPSAPAAFAPLQLEPQIGRAHV